MKTKIPEYNNFSNIYHKARQPLINEITTNKVSTHMMKMIVKANLKLLSVYTIDQFLTRKNINRNKNIYIV